MRRDAYATLQHWAAPAPVEALGLLGPSFSLDPMVRQLAASAVESCQSWLPLTAMALRFEANYCSPLHVALLSQAAATGVESPFGEALFWALWHESQQPLYADKAGFVCDMLIRWTSNVAGLQQSVTLVRQLLNVFEVALSGRSTRDELRSLSRSGGSLPLAGSVGALTSSQYSDKMGSLELTFADCDATVSLWSSLAGEEFVALQLVKTMHSLWALKGRSLGRPAYEMVGLSANVYLASVQNGQRGNVIPIADCIGDEIALFLDEQNATPESRTEARKRLSETCAALCVTSYVLGECLLDHVFLASDGSLSQLRHSIVDSRRSVRASSASTRFVIAGPVAVALGSMVESTVALTARAFRVVRKNAWVLSSVLSLADRNRNLDARLMEIRLRLHGASEHVLADFREGLL